MAGIPMAAGVPCSRVCDGLDTHILGRRRQLGRTRSHGGMGGTTDHAEGDAGAEEEVS